MPPAKAFTLFSTLPLELRLQIWSEALSFRSVWAVTHNRPSGVDQVGVNYPSFSMAHIGPAPYLAGLSSREARRMLEQAYIKPIRGPDSRPQWVNMDQTVVYLGDDFDAISVIDKFHAPDLSRFKHVALAWSQFYWISKACQRLANACPTLYSIIIRLPESDDKAADHRTFSNPLCPLTATYYAKIATYTNSELGYTGLDTDYFRSLLLEYFHASRPQLHILPPDLGDLQLCLNS